MAKKYPHLDDTEFPDIGGMETYAYGNDFDYSRYSPSTTITLLSVPWPSDYSDVALFADVPSRDAWVASQKGLTVKLENCMCRVPADELKVPIPYGTAQLYNYAVVDVTVPTSPSQPVENVASQRVERYCYFITSSDFAATSTTRLNVTVDWWQTYIYRMRVKYMWLERGHAPMAATNVNRYLENPIANCRYLGAPDVNFGEATVAGMVDDYVINDGTTLACISTTSSPEQSWTDSAGNRQVPASLRFKDGISGPSTIAIDPSQLSGLLNWCLANRPQFLPTIKAVFFAPSKMLNIGTAVGFGDYVAHYVTGTQVSVKMMELTKEGAGLPAAYQDIAKLYTYPYSYIAVTDEAGNTTQVHIEDTDGSLDFNLALSTSWPYLGVDGHATSVGGTTARSIRFKNISNRARTYQGAWFEFLRHWDIPTFEVVESDRIYEDFAGEFNRDAARTGYTNAYASAVASADTAVTNTANSGSAQTRNQSLANALASGTVSRNNAASTEITSIGNATSQAFQAYDAGLQRNVQEADANAVAATTLTNAIGGAVGAIASGNIAGMVGSVISGVTAGVNAAVMLNASATKVELAITNSQDKVTSQSDSNTSINTQNTQTQTKNVSAANTAQTSMTSNSVSTANANAANSAATAKANAARSQAASKQSVDAQLLTAAVTAPREFGAQAGTSLALNAPMMLTATFMRQGDGPLSAAGDEMLRYGYALNMQWDVTTFLVMPRFSYWQGRAEVLPVGGCPGGAVDAVRAMLAAGVTVWGRPEDIGLTSIYDN